MAYKVFTNGSVLNASEINDNLMNQSVMVFSNSAARSAAITTPLEGMLTWLEDSNKYQNYNGSAWVDLGGGGAILQVVSVTKTDTFTTTSSTFTDVTGLSLSITPSSATSKILVMPFVSFSQITVSSAHFRVLRGSTPVLVGNTAGNRISATFGATGSYQNTGFGQSQASPIILDSPASTSAQTYKIDCRIGLGGTVCVNRYGDDSDNADHGRQTSTLTLMEVAA